MPGNHSPILFATLLEAPKIYGDARVRVARATAETQAGPFWVRFLSRFAGEVCPHAEGDRVLVVLAYGDHTTAYAIATFAPGPPAAAGRNYEVHARGAGDLRFLASAGGVLLKLAGDGVATVEAKEGVRIASSDDTVDVTQTGALPAEEVALYARTSTEIQALNGAVDAIVSALGAAYPALAVAVTAAKLAPFTASGVLPPVIVGSQSAINLRAEPDPV